MGEDASVHLSTEHTFSSLALPGGAELPVVELPGISHIIAEGLPADPLTLAPILQAAREQLSAPAVGVLILGCGAALFAPGCLRLGAGQHGFREQLRLGLAGSGHLSQAGGAERGCSMSIAQPGGRIRVVLQKLDGALVSCKIGGAVALTEQEAEIGE